MNMILPVKLTEDELNAKRDELAKCAAELNKTEQEKAEASSRFGGQVKKIRYRITELADHITSRREYRETACEERPDYDKNIVEVYRKDTDELVSSRVMSPEERQRKFKLLPMKEKEAAKSE